LGSIHAEDWQEHAAMFKWKRVTPLRAVIGMLLFVPMFSLLIALQSGRIENLMVVSESMEPTLSTGDRVLMKNTGSYTPHRGDVVVLKDPEEEGTLLTKRVVAVSGDLIRIASGFLYVNGRQGFAETYPTNENVRINWPDTVIRVPKGDVFVMGDNRNVSYDSLNFGPVPVDSVRGVLTYRYWPPTKLGEIQ